jgi:hypothetical protein
MTMPPMMEQQPTPGAVQPPVPPPPFTMPPPFLPFTPRPNDTEPELSQIWARKLSKVMSSAKYTAFGPEWQNVLDEQYTRTRQAAAVASGAQPTAPAGKPKQQATQPGGPAPSLQADRGPQPTPGESHDG